MNQYLQHATRLRTYEDYRHEARSWAAECREGTADALLITLGAPGIGKTEVVTRALQEEGYDEDQPDGYGFFRGVMRGLHLYKNEYAYRHNPMVIDDIRALLNDPNAIDILLASTDTRAERLVSWETAHRAIGEGEGKVPPSFIFRGYLAINANSWPKKHDLTMEALLSRGACLVFEPSAEETYAYAGPWYLDGSRSRDEIYAYVGSILDEIPTLDLRVLVRDAPRLYRRYPDDWRDRLKRQLVPENRYPLSVVKQLMLSDTRLTETERRSEFVRLTGLSERSYWRMKKDLGYSEKRTPRVPPEQDGRRRESRNGNGHCDTDLVSARLR